LFLSYQADTFLHLSSYPHSKEMNVPAIATPGSMMVEMPSTMKRRSIYEKQYMAEIKTDARIFCINTMPRLRNVKKR
jgi:hypothetical protein